MKAMRIGRPANLDNLRLGEAEAPTQGPGEIRIEI